MKQRLVIYKTYHFVDQDPAIDKVRQLIGDSSYTSVHEASNVSASTLGNWMRGKTKRPQFATIAAVVYALRGKIVIVDDKGRTISGTSQKKLRKR